MRPLITLTILICTLGVAEAQIGPPLLVPSEFRITSDSFAWGMQQFSRPPAEWEGKARRIRKSHVSNYGDGKTLGRVSEILEFDAAGSFRRHITVDSPYQKSVQEIIAIGNFTFTRMDGRPWLRKDRELFGLAVPSGAPFETRRTGPAGTFKYYKPGAAFEFKLGSGIFKGENLRVYIRTVMFSSPGNGPGTVIEQEQTNRYWLADSGRMVKYEDVKINRGSGAGTHLTEEWELDPSIQIEAPNNMSSERGASKS